MALKWWEKTNEYTFILLCGREKLLKLAPLDGNEEKAGDTLISNNNKWIIIEFKKDQYSINTEIDKFINFDKAKKDLDNTRLKLKCVAYFTGREQPNINEMLSKGKDKSEFKTYLAKLISYKKSNKGTASSGNGNLDVENYALVAAVDTDGNIVECQSLSEFSINEVLDITINNDYSEPSINYKNLEL